MSKNIALIGASGNIGSKITQELLSRGYNVTAIARNPEKVDASERVTPVAGDILQPQQLAETLKGHDAVICAASFIPNESEKLLEAIRLSGVNRYLMVGGAASLLNEDGVKVWDTLEGLPDGVMNYIQEGMRALDLLKEADDFRLDLFIASSGNRAG